VTSCALATREDSGITNVHSLSFRELHAASQSGEVSYAMAQKVLAQVTIPDGGASGQRVTLNISDYDGRNKHSFQLKPGDDAYRLDVGNDPEAPLDRDDPCDDGVARHFKHFYEMARTVPEKELLPHVSPTQSAAWLPLQPSDCKDLVFGLDARPICPVVTFNP